MAISQLVSVGYQKDANSPVRRAYHRTDNDKVKRVEKVSSNMFTESFLNSVIDMLRGFNTDIAKLHESAKKTLMSLAKLIKSVKELNKDITARFKALNTDLNASKLDFVRNVLTTPTVLPDGSIGTLAEAQQQAKTPEKQEEGGSLLDLLLDLLPDGKGKRGGSPSRLGGAGALGRILGRLAGPLGLVYNLATSDESKEFKDIKQNTYMMKLDEVLGSHPRKNELIATFNQMSDDKKEEFYKKYFFTINPFADSKRRAEEGVAELEKMFDAGRAAASAQLTPPGAPSASPQQPPVSYQQGGAGFSSQQTPGRTSERRPTPPTPGGAHYEGQKPGSPQAAASGGGAAPPIPQPPQRDRGQTVSTAGMESPTGTTMADASGVDAYKDSSFTAAPTAGGVVQGSPESMPATQKDVDEALDRAIKNTANAPFPQELPGEVDAYLDKKAVQTVPPAPPEEPKLDATISSEPIVINNNEVNSSQSTSGGTNYVTGQNFPMSAHNPYLQEFIARQNIQYT